MNVYSEALELLAGTQGESAVSLLWKSNSDSISRGRAECGNEHAFIRWITSVDHFTAPHLWNDPQRDAIIDKWLTILKEVPVEESPHVAPEGMVIRDGKRLSTQMLLHTYYAERIDTLKPLRILEIGAGFGGLARILNTTMPRSYTILDLPSSLFCSYVYLRMHFPDRIFVWVKDASDLDAPADFRFVPAHMWRDLLSHRFDMAVNTCSMGEMLPENVADYMELIGETCGYFYSHNRAGLERVPSLPPDTALPAVTLDDRWEILFDEVEGNAQTDPLAPPSRELLVKRCAR